MAFKTTYREGHETMSKYEIFTDSSCDLPQEIINQYDIEVIQLEVIIDDGAMVIGELQEKYPNQKMLSVDTLCASVGQGLLVYFAALKREEGASIEEVFHAVMEMKDKIQVSEEGKLETVGKVRGRKSAMRQLVSEMKETADIDRCIN